MIINGKIKYIEQSHKDGWLTVVLGKTRKGKHLEIPIFFASKYRQSVTDQELRVGMRIDVSCFAYGKKRGVWWSTYLVASYFREYKVGQQRYKEVVNEKTGEIVKLKDQFDTDYSKMSKQFEMDYDQETDSE